MPQAYSKIKLLAIIGPNASGKSELAVNLARKFGGEIISADSRQVYRSLNIGAGKVPGKWQSLPSYRQAEGSIKKRFFVYRRVRHHLIDFVSPNRQYSVADFQIAAQRKIQEISRRGNLPILCGGTGYWIDAVIENQTLPQVRPNKVLRERLEKLTAEKLYNKLKRLDPRRSAVIDRHNKRRLIRALEIISATGQAIPPLLKGKDDRSEMEVLLLGMKFPQKKLYENINHRLRTRLKAGMVTEVKKLHKQNLSWKRLESLGLEYKYCALLLQGKLTKPEFLTQLSFAIKHYAKRQRTWFDKNPNIHWISTNKQAVVLTNRFLGVTSATT